nr:PREDICTED: uncharacterized protein LOC103313817 isoform X3 [Tribolium castaneum]|eukprot:XP_015837466.1 PREDICTED: uncharacterized protein LOC103313817 isoform X3 [Tribolium castaneum]
MATSNKLQILSLAFRTSYTGSSVRVPQIKAALVAEGYNLHATLCHSWDVHCLGDDLGDSSRPNHSKLEPLSSESDAISRKSMPASCIPTSRPFSKGVSFPITGLYRRNQKLTDRLQNVIICFSVKNNNVHKILAFHACGLRVVHFF